MKDYSRLYIGGEWVGPAGSGTLDVVNSTTEEIMGRIPEGVPADVDRAVAAARGAFDAWSTTPASSIDLASLGIGSRFFQSSASATLRYLPASVIEWPW